MIKAIIFDCFGVIIGKGFENTYRSAGGDPNLDREFIDHTLQQANLGQIEDETFHSAMAGKLGISGSQWRKTIKEAERPDTDLLAYIKELKQHYKTAVLSNANKGVLQREIGSQWINDCFDEVIVSAEVGLVKPEPAIYHLAAQRLGVELSECIFIDDSSSFLDKAKELGMEVVLYKGLDSLKDELNRYITS